jgi:hypothetical protein
MMAAWKGRAKRAAERRGDRARYEATAACVELAGGGHFFVTTRRDEVMGIVRGAIATDA